MNQSRFTSMLFSAVMILFFASCNGSDDTTTTDTTTDSTNNTVNSTPAAPASTIISTPQNMAIVTHKVSNFEKWFPSYEEHDSMRLASGIHSYVVGRGLYDTSMVLVAVKLDDVEKAKAFSKDPNLKKAMQKGGVVGAPTFKFITSEWQDTAIISTDIRSQTTFMVKDWDTWVKAFESGTQDRLNNGIITRAYGHDMDNNKSVRVVVALSDTAKAFAYWKSDALKQKMAESGMVGQPKRFVYRMVKRY